MARYLLYLSLFVPVLSALLMLTSPVAADSYNDALTSDRAPMTVTSAAPTGGLVTESLSGTLTVSDLANALVGDGVTISNISYTGVDIAAGIFSGGDDIIGFEEGIILSTGNINSVVGPNTSDNTTTNNQQPGDADLDALSSITTFDATVLEFDFVPDGDNVFFQFVFSSDEYNEGVDTDYNDIFAFFVNGINCATVEGDPVTINTINNGPNNNGPGSHPELYINNDLQNGGGSINTEMDGFTTVLTCSASVTANSTNHLKLAIADGDDRLFDSNVFIESGSLSTEPALIALTPSTISLCVLEEHTVTATISDGEAGLPDISVTFDIVSGPHSGTTETNITDVAGEATFTYTGTLTGTDVIEASFVNNQGNTITSSPVTVEWVLEGCSVNQAPIAVDDTYSTTEDTPLSISAAGVLDNDNDPDGDSLNVSLDSDVSNGILELAADGSFVYTPNENFNGEDHFSYTASDGTLSDTAMVTITISPINDAPVAVDDAYSTTEDTPLSISAAGVLDNDNEPDGDSLNASLDSDVSNGILELAADGSFVYTPNENFNGEDHFSYIASDGTLSDTAMVTITISPINDAPVAVDDSYSTAEDTPLSVSAAGVLDNDSDPDGDSLNVSLDSDVSNGILELAADGSFVYTPNENFNGEDHFSYIVSDGALSDTAMVTISVTSINDSPMADAGDDQSADEGEEVQFEGSFIDPGLRLAAGATVEWDFGDGDTATDSLSPTHTYDDDGDFTVTLTVTDSEGASGSDTLLVTVENVAPEVTVSGDMTATVGIAADFSGAFSDSSTLDTHMIAWDFGDGNNASDTLMPSHTYEEEGSFTVTLTVTDDDGGVGEAQLTVTVIDEAATAVSLSDFDKQVTINWWAILTFLVLLAIGVSFRLQKLASQR